jgi:hypothetical protein
LNGNCRNASGKKSRSGMNMPIEETWEQWMERREQELSEIDFDEFDEDYESYDYDFADQEYF